MRVLIISDTHRYLGNFYEALERVGAVDQILHLGDVEGDEEEIRMAANCPVAFVAGNNDYFSSCGSERELTLGGVRIFMTHGHHYGASMGSARLFSEGHSRKVDVVLYGHTHRPSIEYRKPIYLVNPGSLSYPRQQNHIPSYVLMEIAPDGKPVFAINYLK